MTEPATRERKPPTPADVGRLLTQILTMYQNLVAEAVYAAEARDYPGGDAMNRLGPAADLEAWQHKFETAERRADEEREKGHLRRAEEITAYVADQFDTESHPELVLTHWETRVREQRAQTVDLQSDVTHAVTYLRHSIDWMFSTIEDGRPTFTDTNVLVRDLRAVRTNLETVTKSGKRAEFTRVHCISPECETHPRLMKIWAAQVRWDRYRCPACRTEYTRPQFELAKSQNLHSRGLERFIAPLDAADAAEAPPKTVYSWMKRRKAERIWITPAAGKPWAHVWWPDIRELGMERKARLRRQAIRRAELKAQRAAEEEAKIEAERQEQADSDTPNSHRKAS